MYAENVQGRPSRYPGHGRELALRLMIEHEIHHFGQLYLALGIPGTPSPMLYGLTSEDVSAKSRRPDSGRT